jgi:hypothetical protein
MHEALKINPFVLEAEGSSPLFPCEN